MATGLQEIDEGDQAILESFMPSAAASGPFGGTRNLADIIMQKIQEREAGGAATDRLQDGMDRIGSLGRLDH